MTGDMERNLGEQPLAGLLDAAGLDAHRVVAASGGAVTHKMVQRARKGRRLTPRAQAKVARAVAAATGRDLAPRDLFTY